MRCAGPSQQPGWPAFRVDRPVADVQVAVLVNFVSPPAVLLASRPVPSDGRAASSELSSGPQCFSRAMAVVIEGLAEEFQTTLLVLQTRRPATPMICAHSFKCVDLRYRHRKARSFSATNSTANKTTSNLKAKMTVSIICQIAASNTRSERYST